jgi:hypothetical protein
MIPMIRIQNFGLTVRHFHKIVEIYPNCGYVHHCHSLGPCEHYGERAQQTMQKVATRITPKGQHRGMDPVYNQHSFVAAYIFRYRFCQ